MLSVACVGAQPADIIDNYITNPTSVEVGKVLA